MGCTISKNTMHMDYTEFLFLQVYKMVGLVGGCILSVEEENLFFDKKFIYSSGPLNFVFKGQLVTKQSCFLA